MLQTKKKKDVPLSSTETDWQNQQLTNGSHKQKQTTITFYVQL